MARWVLVFAALCGSCLAGCGGGDDDSKGSSNCGTVQSPKMFTLSALSPALGASVPNANIVQSFKIAEPLALQSLTLAFTAAHTAGTPTTGTVTYSVTAASDGVVYTSSPVTWSTAPGKVELASANVYAEPTSGCVYAFPSPLFSYDVTAP